MSETKAVVTVAEMARMVSLSRARFYQLVQAGVFPPPVYDVATHRPVYVEEQQRVCLEVRRRNCGITGKPVLFYTGRDPKSPAAKGPKKPKASQHKELIQALKSLGLSSVTASQIEAAIKEVFPAGIAGAEQAEIIRAVFLHLKRQDSGDSVGK